jgi:predicted nucleic acid-binding protein
MVCVFDAPAALSLMLEEEAESTVQEVDGVFRRGQMAVVPTLFVHEMTNALVAAIRRKRIDGITAIVDYSASSTAIAAL